VPPEVVRDLAVVLAAAGLTDEATTAAHELVEVLEADRASAGRRADGLIAAAIVHLDYGNAMRAIELARRAVRANHRQDNVEGERHSKLVLLRAHAATDRVTKRHAVAAADLASVLKDRYAAERLEAQLLAGRMARQVGLSELATQQFQAASAQRRKGSALRRSAAWLATAQLADMRGDRAGMLRGLRAGPRRAGHPRSLARRHRTAGQGNHARRRTSPHGHRPGHRGRLGAGSAAMDGALAQHPARHHDPESPPGSGAHRGVGQAAGDRERHRGSGRRRPRGEPPTHRGAHPEAHAWERR
jgi:hypothetical protein